MQKLERPKCFGTFPNQQSTICEKTCDKDEQKMCYEVWNNNDKENSEGKKSNVPWYKKENGDVLPEGVCETCG